MSYLFSRPSFVSIGDPYPKVKSEGVRSYSEKFEKPFMPTNPGVYISGKKGPMFSKLNYQAEPYYDRSALDVLYAKKRSEKMNKMKRLTEPWKYSSPPSASCGLGSYYGTIGGKIEHIAGCDPNKTKKPRRNFDEDVMLKNFYTSPSKKGGFGYSGTTIQKENVYYNKLNPYDTLRKERTKKFRKDRERMAGIEPFRTSSAPRKYFDGHSKVDAMKIHTIPEDVLKKLKARKKSAPKAKKVIEEPFRPYGTNKCFLGTFSKFEAPKNDPYERKQGKPKLPEGKERFKPNGKSKSGPCRSVIFEGRKILHNFYSDINKNNGVPSKGCNFFI